MTRAVARTRLVDVWQIELCVTTAYSLHHLTGAFGVNFFVSGGMRSVGLLFIEVVEVFKADRGLTALTISLMMFGFALFCKSVICRLLACMWTLQFANLGHCNNFI
jgi:hypothetical protein